MKVLVLITLTIFSVVASATTSNEKKEDNRPKVFIEKMLKQDIGRSVEYMGKVAPTIKSKIYSPIEGVVQKLLVKPGQQIKKGQIMAILKQNLVGYQVLPVKIRAPLSGIIYRPNFTEDALVQKNAHLFTIFGNKKYKVDLHLSPEDANEVEVGSKVSLKINEKDFAGTVYALAAELDSQTGTRSAEIYLDGEMTQLRPGLIAKAHFTFDKHSGFLISKNHLQKRGKINILRLLDEDNKVKEYEVTIANRIKDKIEVVSAELKEDSKLIVKSSVEPLIKDTEVNVIQKEDKTKVKAEEKTEVKK